MAGGVIHVIDDDDAVLDSLEMLLQRRGYDVRLYRSAGEFLDSVGAATTGCIVSDIKMPGMSGLDLQRELRLRRPDLPLIFITAHGDIGMAVAATKAGAVDFIEKPIAKDKLFDSIAHSLTSPEAGLGNADPRARERLSELSDRQREVLALVAAGYSSKQIAAKMKISARTVESYRSVVMMKLGFKSMAEMVKFAVKAGLAD